MLASFIPTGVRRVAGRAYVGNGFVTDEFGFVIYAAVLAVAALFQPILQGVVTGIILTFAEYLGLMAVNILLFIAEFYCFRRYVLNRS
jgi:hypothetical protein